MIAPWLILIIGGIYVLITIDLVQQKKFGLALTFAAYALSNVGLWMVSK
jgi:hypothetical protein